MPYTRIINKRGNGWSTPRPIASELSNGATTTAGAVESGDNIAPFPAPADKKEPEPVWLHRTPIVPGQSWASVLKDGAGKGPIQEPRAPQAPISPKEKTNNLPKTVDTDKLTRNQESITTPEVAAVKTSADKHPNIPSPPAQRRRKTRKYDNTFAAILERQSAREPVKKSSKKTAVVGNSEAELAALDKSTVDKPNPEIESPEKPLPKKKLVWLTSAPVQSGKSFASLLK